MKIANYKNKFPFILHQDCKGYMIIFIREANFTKLEKFNRKI